MHESLGKVLARAYYNHPAVTYVLPDPVTREDALFWFFASVAIPASRACGEIYTTTNVDGGCLWIGPGVELTIGQAVRTERRSLPFNLDRGSIRRWINFSEHLESVRSRLADKPHWYLMAVGAEPSHRGQVIRRDLMAPIFSAADGNVQSCYVETFSETDLPFYLECGFQITGAGQIPEDGPNFWTLIRAPRGVYAPGGMNHVREKRRRSLWNYRFSRKLLARNLSQNSLKA
jgi:hypothetical protein